MKIGLCAAVSVVCGALAACGGAATEESAGEVADDLRAFARTNEPVYYAGEAVAGLRLTHVEAAHRALFVYGECNPEGEGENFHCRGPQIQIQNWPLADRHPSKFMLTPTQAAACERSVVRGVPVAIFETSGGGLEVYAGDVVVVIFARHDLGRAAAVALRRVGGADAKRANLPKPPADVPRALRRCSVDPPSAKLREIERTATARVYWLGPAFEGHPLARVEGDGAHTRFVYGACAQRPDFLSIESCWPPLDVQVQPVAERHPAAYSPAISCRWHEERGALVVTIADAHTLQVFTGLQTVTLVGPDLRLLGRAIRALRSLDRTIAPGNALEAPGRQTRRSVEGRCGPKR
jgi:hypothetical protein